MRTGRYLAIFSVFALSSACAMKPYTPPTDGPLATVTFDGPYMPNALPFLEKRMNVQLFDDCYGGQPNVDGVLGRLMVKEDEFNNREIAIPANAPLFVSFGINDFCMINVGFTPVEGAKYKGIYDTVFAGCRGALIRVDSENERIPDLKSYRLTTFESVVGAKDAWRHCKKFESE